MGLETVNTSGNARLHELNTSNPVGTDNKSQGDDHIRNIKRAIKDQFSGISGDSGSGAVTATAAELNLMDGCTATTAELNKLDGCTATTNELNILDGVIATTGELNTMVGCTATAAELNKLDGVTATTAELNILDGVTATAGELNKMDGCTASTAELNKMDGCTATTTELNYVDGVSSNIQTQLNSKQATMSAGTNIDISSNTIHASGCPDFACIGRVATDHGHEIGESGYVINQHDQIVDKIGSGAYLSGGKVVLPAGTYYYEATAHLRNTSGNDDVNWAKLQLFTDGGTAIGYPSMSYMGERSAHQFVIIGTFTTTGDGFQLKAWASSDDDGRIHYGDASGATQRQASTIKFWRSDR
jgi:hypothetical protein